MRVRNSASYGVALVAVCGVIAGCGSSSNNTTSNQTKSTQASQASGASGGNSAVQSLVPPQVKSKGTITVAADATYAPNEFIAPDGHTVVGMDADLVKALAGVMGLKANVVNVTFDAIIPGLAAGKYDMGASSFTDTKAREKVVNFVDYFTAGESFYTKAQGGTTIASIADLCGHTVAVESTTTEQADATTQGKKCKAAGKPGVNVLVFPKQTDANLAVSDGRAQLGFADTPVAAYQVKKSNGQFKLVGATFASAPYGLAVPKTSGLDKAVEAALKVLMQNGTYTKILDKWGVQGGAISASKVKINGATS